MYAAKASAYETWSKDNILWLFFCELSKKQDLDCRLWCRHERGIKRNSKQKGSPVEIQTFGRASCCPELSVGNKSDGSILNGKVDYCVFLK